MTIAKNYHYHSRVSNAKSLATVSSESSITMSSIGSSSSGSSSVGSNGAVKTKQQQKQQQQVPQQKQQQQTVTTSKVSSPQSTTTTTTSTTITPGGHKKRVAYNSESNSVAIDLSQIHIQSLQHCFQVRDSIAAEISSHQGRNVKALVNYDQFHIEEELIDGYIEHVMRYLTDKYYSPHSILRYITDSSKLSESLIRMDQIINQNRCCHHHSEYGMVGSTQGSSPSTIGTDVIVANMEKAMLKGIKMRGLEIVGELYIVEREIGQGSYGRVKLAHNRRTGQQVAIKELNLRVYRETGEMEYLENECRILKQIASSDPHTNIVQLFDIIQQHPSSVANGKNDHNACDDQKLYMVFEYCSGGTLESYLEEELMDGSMSEQQAREYFVQIISGLDHLHNKLHVVHRDLQLQNICLQPNHHHQHRVKICDFGLSTHFVPNQRSLNVYCGNGLYLAPQVHMREFYEGPELDVWSAGVCLYRMITGFMPFRDAERIVQCQLTVPLDEEECMSDSCKDLLSHIFHPDVNQRYMSVDDVKKHPWFQQATAYNNKNKMSEARD